MSNGQTPTPQNVKKFKRGEFLFKEGDKADFVYILQSGRVSLSVVRPNNRIEIFQVSGSQIVGEQALYGMTKHILSAEALGEVTAIELPVAIAKAQVDAAPGLLKVLMKSMSDELKLSIGELKSLKMEKEAVACPQIYVPRLFTAINLVTRHLGKKQENGDYEIAWSSLRMFGVRMFLEAPQRLQSCVELLCKLKHLDMIFEKNEEGETELSKLVIKNLQAIEDFSEFYQYNLYKGGVAEILTYDEIAANIARLMVKATEGVEVDRHNAVRVLFDKVVELAQEEGLTFKTTQIDLLEKKGLFMKRTPNDKEVWLSFDRKEFAQTVTFWQIINEINKWNETGRVNMTEEPKKKAKPGDASCPECSTVVMADHKFCGNCGFKLKAAA